MIARLSGTVVRKEPTRLVLDCRGIGFDVAVPLSTSDRVGDAGAEVLLEVVPRFTQTGVELYGFATPEERDVFRLLLSVKGIGPKAGLNILSRFSPAETMQTVAAGRLDVLRSVPGIGPKKAERVLKDLAEKTVPVEEAKPILADAQSALMSLGLTRREAKARLEKVTLTDEMSLAELLKLALKEGSQR